MSCLKWTNCDRAAVAGTQAQHEREKLIINKMIDVFSLSVLLLYNCTKQKMFRYYEIDIQYLLFVSLHTFNLLAWRMQIVSSIMWMSIVVVVIVDIDSTECAVVPGLYSLYSVQWREWTVLSVEKETRARQHRDLWHREYLILSPAWIMCRIIRSVTSPISYETIDIN